MFYGVYQYRQAPFGPSGFSPFPFVCFSFLLISLIFVSSNLIRFETFSSLFPFFLLFACVIRFGSAAGLFGTA